MIAYETPNFACFKVYAQYGMGNAVEDYGSEENESSSDRFYAIGATYNNGPFAAYLAVDSINYATASNGTAPVTNPDSIDDSLTVTLGGSYDFEVVKIYLGGQYFDEMKLSSLGGVMADLDSVGWRTEKVKAMASPCPATLLSGVARRSLVSAMLTLNLPTASKMPRLATRASTSSVML